MMGHVGMLLPWLLEVPVGYLLATSRRGASVIPAYLAGPISSEEGPLSGPQRRMEVGSPGNYPTGCVSRPAHLAGLTRSHEGPLGGSDYRR